MFYDIETSPNLAYVWGKYEQNVLAFRKERELLSVAFKFQGDKDVSILTRKGKKSDKGLVKQIHKLLSSADVVVAHNGDQFDAKVIKARMLFHGLAPLKRLVSVDTKKAAKAYFQFNGNGLNDLGQFLKLGKKVAHTGFDVWLGCMANDAKSWALMERYNKQDVVLLEKVYDRLRPWIENHPNMSLMKGKGLDGCPACGHQRIQKRGLAFTNRSLRQRIVCMGCGHNFLVPVRKEAA